MRFDDLAYVEAAATVVNKRDREVTVSLLNFAVSYRQDDVESLIEDMRPGTRVTVDGGQVVKLVKAKDGSVEKTVLTKEWTDWIDNPELGPVAFQFGTRPLVTQESPISDVWKRKLLTLNEGDVSLNRFSPTGLDTIPHIPTCGFLRCKLGIC